LIGTCDLWGTFEDNLAAINGVQSISDPERDFAVAILTNSTIA
jgi:hypothetical protein